MEITLKERPRWIHEGRVIAEIVATPADKISEYITAYVKDQIELKIKGKV